MPRPARACATAEGRNAYRQALLPGETTGHPLDHDRNFCEDMELPPHSPVSPRSDDEDDEDGPPPREQPRPRPPTPTAGLFGDDPPTRQIRRPRSKALTQVQVAYLDRLWTAGVPAMEPFSVDRKRCLWSNLGTELEALAGGAGPLVPVMTATQVMAWLKRKRKAAGPQPSGAAATAEARGRVPHDQSGANGPLCSLPSHCSLCPPQARAGGSGGGGGRACGPDPRH